MKIRGIQSSWHIVGAYSHVTVLTFSSFCWDESRDWISQLPTNSKSWGWGCSGDFQGWGQIGSLGTKLRKLTRISEFYGSDCTLSFWALLFPHILLSPPPPDSGSHGLSPVCFLGKKQELPPHPTPGAPTSQKASCWNELPVQFRCMI